MREVDIKCLKCGLESDSLSWDNSWFENTGKWRLYDKAVERPHICSRKKKKKKEKPAVKKVVCPKCAIDSPNRYIDNTKLQEHIKKEHIDWGDWTE